MMIFGMGADTVSAADATAPAAKTFQQELIESSQWLEL